MLSELNLTEEQVSPVGSLSASRYVGMADIEDVEAALQSSTGGN